jgi:nicotinamide mononucleotide transporter
MLDTALEFAGAAVSWLELAAFALALAGVALTALERHWGWPLSIMASALYGWLFFEHRLYGDSALQLYFIAISGWGWWLWSRPVADGRPALEVRRLGLPALLAVGVTLLACWLALGALLARLTDTDVPWFDAAPTVGSVVAQALLARKILQAWHLWIAVNAIAIALFAWKALWLTAILYALLLALSIAALVRWRRLCP